MLSTLKNKIIEVDTRDVITQANRQDIDVRSIKDFRQKQHHYDRIEKVMDNYRSSFIRRSALGGLTTGIGGFFTSLTFASLNSTLLAIRLHRLSQRFAILNGFDSDEPLQKNKITAIYFEALGANAATQATLKHQFMKAKEAATSAKASKNWMLKSIILAARFFGKRLSSKQAGRLVPVAGGLVGATINYSFARKIGKKMQQAYKEAYFDVWHNKK